jgi:pilus assembly protein Flp/PilA
MSAIKSIFARLYRDKRGASMVEYSILIGIITAGSIGFIATVGTSVEGAWKTLSLLSW